MTAMRDALLATLWRGRDPYAGFPRHLYERDTQGWGSQHPYLAELGEARLIVEVGVWKGASTIAMASLLRERGVDGVVLAVDTWLGAVDHWIKDKWFDQLGFDHGYPSLARKFLANIIAAELTGHVLPLPLDSINAAALLAHHGIAVDAIHLDGGHEYGSVAADLRAWWPLLKPGGLLIGDDYGIDGKWPGVRKAFDEFLDAQDISEIEHRHGKCRVTKP